MSSIFKFQLLAPKFSYLPANRPIRHLVLPIDIAYLTMNVYRFYTELRHIFYIDYNFRRVISFPIYFVHSVMKCFTSVKSQARFLPKRGHCTFGAK